MRLDISRFIANALSTMMNVGVDGAAVLDEPTPPSPETRNCGNSSSRVSCPLRSLVERDDVRALETLLYDCIWDRFSRDPIDCLGSYTYTSRAASAENEDLPGWFLHAAVFTGCPVLIDYTLEKLRDTARLSTARTTSFKRKRSLDPDICSHEDRDVFNTRIDCKFPLTDTWIHRSFKLCLSPLHLACWRLDHRSVKSLLAHGADPSILALEESDAHDFGTVPAAAKNGVMLLGKATEQIPTANGEDHEAKSIAQSGICPLHFIALGIRASPKTSLFAGMQESIMHDLLPCSNVRAGELDSNLLPSYLTSGEKHSHKREVHSPDIELHLSRVDDAACSIMTEHISQSRNVRDKSSAIVECIEALISAGARPNFCPPQKVLIGANPLDTILQPPMRIFYAPSAARGNQNPVALRRQDLAQTAGHVIAACTVLLRHEASVSESFRDLYSWRPGILDCFHLYNSEQSRQLVRFCVRLGLFSTRNRPRDPARGPDFHSFLSVSNPIHEAACYPVPNTSGCDAFDPMMIRRFVADVVNMEIPLPLASIVLRWCPFSVLLCAKRETTAAMKRIGLGADGVAGPRTHNLNSPGLADLAQVVRELQLASLKHKAALRILESVRFRPQSIMGLPIPPSLKRGLVDLDL